MNPWIALIIGILIGWLLGWLLESWFGRRRRQECEGRLASAELALRGRETELKDARDRLHALQADLEAKGTVTAAVAGAEAAPLAAAMHAASPEAPSEEVKWPAVAAGVAEYDASLPSVGSEVQGRAAGLSAAAEGALAAGASRADDLTRIGGIGPKFAAQLREAGITSFSTLATSAPEQLAAIINAPEWRKANYAGWIAEAGRLASESHFRKADDLLIIEGIGPVYAEKLKGAGISTFAALAAATEARLAEVIQPAAWQRVNFGEWIEQAHLAAAGDEVGLKALQDRLFSRD